jgi:putative chitinase
MAAIPKTILQALMPGLSNAKCDIYLPFLNEAMDEFEINNYARQAAFLAQIAHESGELRYMRELWGPTAAQLKYEGRKDLGNTRLGDGKRFKGRGVIQITGRANYEHYGKKLGIDLTNAPEMAELPQYTFRIAGCFWQEHCLNDLADDNDFELITRTINGGLNGYADRCKYYKKAQELLL